MDNQWRRGISLPMPWPQMDCEDMELACSFSASARIESTAKDSNISCSVVVSGENQNGGDCRVSGTGRIWTSERTMTSEKREGNNATATETTWRWVGVDDGTY